MSDFDYMNAHKEELREWLRRRAEKERIETIKLAYAVLFFFVVWVALGVILEYFA